MRANKLRHFLKNKQAFNCEDAQRIPRKRQLFPLLALGIRLSSPILILGLFISGLFVQSVLGQQGREPSNIMVTGADTVWQERAVASEELEGVIGPVSKRIVLRFGNRLRQQALVDIPTALEEALEGVEKRVVLRFANRLWKRPFPTIPTQLIENLEEIDAHVTLHYANRQRSYQLACPMIEHFPCDTTGPTISNVTIQQTASDSVIIRWQTDEPADSRVAYGTRPGEYGEPIVENELVLNHEIVLSGLAPGIYYFQISSVDADGNVGLYEGAFTIGPKVYLPLMMK